VQRNRALLLGVATFGARVGDDEEPALGDLAWPPLDFVEEVTPLVRSALGDLGYDVTGLHDPDREALVGAVGAALEDESSLVVHVVSHGDAGDSNRLDVVPSCGRTGFGTDIGDWVSTAQKRETPVLFLLDLCRAGKVTRLPWLVSRAGEDSGVWVIAGAGPDEDAFDGRFSRSVAAVLAQLAKDGLGTDPSQRFVSFPTVARRIAERVESMPGLPQRVHATLIDPAQPVLELPFFPNPRFVDDPQRQARQAIESPLRSFLDELDDVLDSEHFLGRVGSHFAGRRRQLRMLAQWMDGGVPESGLRVVTGSPGVGKSALLGALVCAAHPVLANAVPHVRARLEAAGCPSRNEYLGAVHARQRRCEELVASLARQFGLSSSGERWTVAGLVRGLATLPTTPVIVVDAVDEALDPQRVMNELLLPLALTTHLDDRPVCRLLVGLRPWREFAELQDLAAEADELLNLDAVEKSELWEDIEEYLTGRLADLPGYAAAAQRPVRERLAATIASRLVVRGNRHPAGPKWGAFLVAGMFAGYLHGIAAATTIEEAERLGATVPRSLPEVLELDLGVHPLGTKVRATLAAVAHAKGEGMPAEVVGLVATGFSDAIPGDGVSVCLDVSRFYLRTTVERDGTTLYRLLHQSLADYLRRYPTAVPEHDVDVSYASAPARARLVLDRMVDAFHGDERGRWASAPPYVLRHAIHHAIEADRVDDLLTDVEFLVHADPSSLRSELDRADASAARVSAAVYRRAWQERGSYPQQPGFEDFRWILAVEAARHGAPELARSLIGDVKAEGWRPRWAAALPFGAGGWVTAVTCVRDGGRPLVAVAGTNGVVWFLDLVSGERVGSIAAGCGSPVSAVAIAGATGKQVIVTGGADAVLRVWDVNSGDLVLSFGAECGWINAIACVRLGDRVVAVVCGDEAVRLWDLTSGLPFGSPHDQHRWGRAVACADLGGNPVAVTGSNDHAVRVWDVASGVLLHPPMRAHRDRVYAVVCTVVGGRRIAVTGGDDDALHVWDMATGDALTEPLVGHSGWISALACTVVDGRPVVVSGAFDRTVRVWDLTTMSCRDILTMPAEVHAVGIAPDGGMMVCAGPDVMVFDRFTEGER